MSAPVQLQTQTQKGGLLEALVKAQVNDVRRQHAGAPGDGYSWHREAAYGNLSSQNGLVKRAQWLNEVRKIYSTGVPWREALRMASTERKKVINDYKTVKNKVIDSYKGRNADTVKCSGVVCPGRYNKPAATVFRPQGHPNKRVLTQAGAIALLKEYFTKRGNLTGRLVAAQRAMKKAIATKKIHTVNPCPDKIVTDARGTTRTIPVRNENCADNWLYRSVKKYDMIGVDHGNKKDSPLYNTKLTKYR